MLHPSKTNMEPEKPTKHNGFQKKIIFLVSICRVRAVSFQGCGWYGLHVFDGFRPMFETMKSGLCTLMFCMNSSNPNKKKGVTGWFGEVSGGNQVSIWSIRPLIFTVLWMINQSKRVIHPKSCRYKLLGGSWCVIGDCWNSIFAILPGFFRLKKTCTRDPETKNSHLAPENGCVGYDPSFPFGETRPRGKLQTCC